MSNVEPSRSPRSDFSLSRVLTALLPAAVIVVGFMYYKQHAIKTEADEQGQKLLFDTLGISKPAKNKLDATFVDANDDLVADAPTDPAQWIDPDPLVFSYIGGSHAKAEEETWKELISALSQATGK